MVRGREFDREVALERAMEHFWEHGYDAASMRDLLGAMKIGRQSLYDTFGDKHSLFLTCLEHYRDMGRQALLTPLAAEDGGLAAIENYFAVTARNMGTPPHRACLIVNTTMELAASDPEAAAITNRFMGELQEAFAKALRVAVSRGEVRVDDVEATGWQLTATALGMVTLSKAGTPLEALEAIASQVLSSLHD